MDNNPAAANPEEIAEVAVSALVLEPALQSRVKMSDQRVRDYEQVLRNGGKLPPLLVTGRPGKFPEEKDYLVLDGWHRAQAIINTGQTRMALVQIIETPLDASPHFLRWIGGRENLKNGEPLSSRDKRELFRAYVKAKQHRVGTCGLKSYRAIAAELQTVSHQTVANWMKKDFPSVFRAMSRAGEDVRDNGAEGTGIRLPDMPSLDDRKIDLFAFDLLAEAKEADNDRRWVILKKIETLLGQLKQEAPCTEPMF